MRGGGLWHIWVKRSGYRDSVGRLKRENHLEDVGVGVRVILKWV
jgi:hypothetical protein